METRQYWEENAPVKYESYNTKDGYLPMGLGDQLNFSTVPSDDEGDYQANYLKKGKQDPMSHRIIEKRRRDRMNNCLADLSRLIPPEYLKKGRGRVEKTEIIEMAIRHLKFLQDKVNAAERQLATEEKLYQTGFQDAITETTRFFVEVQRFDPNDVICSQLTTHLQKHCNQLNKDDHRTILREKTRYTGSSSETNSSSGSSRNHMKSSSSFGVHVAPPDHSTYEHHEPKSETYAMDCDREPPPQMAQDMDSVSSINEVEDLALHNRGNLEPNLRTVRKQEHNDEYIHSYKFKNCIERRFSKSQDTAEPIEVPKISAPNKIYSHKRRRPVKQVPSTSTSNSGSTEEARDTSPQDTSSESPHNHYEIPAPPLSSQFVPVFALNALGKYYVPLSIEYACIARHLGPYDVLDARAAQLSLPLHPVTIHVNFQPCLNYHVKRPLPDRSWRGP